MAKMMKRLLLMMMVMLLAAGAVVPAALAAEVPVVSNATNSMTIYAGMKDTLYVTRDGVEQSPTLYKWKSSKSSVVSVTSKGVITAKKAGTATITATRKSGGSKVTMKVKVKKNKVDNINSKPSATAVAYKSAGIALKSLEIVSPSKVVAEYYVVCNYPSNWKASKVVSVNDAIGTYDKSTGYLYKGICRGISKSIKGFKAKKGKSVQTIKVTFSGSMVDFTNVRLSNYYISSSSGVNATIKYYK